jgi:hypothetical protein
LQKGTTGVPPEEILLQNETPSTAGNRIEDTMPKKGIKIERIINYFSSAQAK